MEVVIRMEKLDSDKYFCCGKRLSFDLPWSIYIVNGDMYIPYYRIYIGNCLMCIRYSMDQCYEYIQNVSYEEAHIAEM